MRITKVGSAWEKMGRAGLYAAVLQKLAGGTQVSPGHAPLALLLPLALHSPIYGDYLWIFIRYEVEVLL